jgi:hypothetical protein
MSAEQQRMRLHGVQNDEDRAIVAQIREEFKNNHPVRPEEQFIGRITVGTLNAESWEIVNQVRGEGKNNSVSSDGSENELSRAETHELQCRI